APQTTGLCSRYWLTRALILTAPGKKIANSPCGPSGTATVGKESVQLGNAPALEAFGVGWSCPTAIAPSRIEEANRQAILVFIVSVLHGYCAPLESFVND